MLKWDQVLTLAGRGGNSVQATRTNQEWISALTGQGSEQAAAIEDLRQHLLRAALYTLVSYLDDLRGLDERERVALAEDCAQVALLSVLSHLSEFRGDSKFTTWAYKFGVNIALTRARRERWKQVSLDELTEDEDMLDWFQASEDLHMDSAELPLVRTEVKTALSDVIRSSLTDRQRQVLKWIVFDGVPMDVVVERLDTNRNAVYQLLHDARLKIKKQLSLRGYDYEEMMEIFG